MHLRADQGVQLLVESETTGKVTHTQDEKNVTEDGTNHTGLDDIDVSFDKSEDSDEQLDDVTLRLSDRSGRIHAWKDLPEGSVEQATPGLTKPESDLFSGKGQTAGERDDAQQASDEDGHVRLAGVGESPSDREQDRCGADDGASLDCVLHESAQKQEMKQIGTG